MALSSAGSAAKTTASTENGARTNGLESRLPGRKDMAIERPEAPAEAMTHLHQCGRDLTVDVSASLDGFAWLVNATGLALHSWAGSILIFY